jgi:PAS domain S-box-containing protein
MRLSLRTKVGSVLGVLAVLAVLGALVGLRSADAAHGRTTTIRRENVADLVLLSRTSDAAHEVRERMLLRVLSVDPAEQADLDRDIERLDQVVEEGLADFNLRDRPEQRARLALVQQAWSTYHDQRTTQTLFLSRQGRAADARAAALGPGAQLFTAFDTAVERVRRQVEDSVAERLSESEEALADSRRTTGVLLGLGLLFGGTGAVVLGRSVTRRVGAVASAARGLSKGDLAQRVPVQGSDEIAELASAFNQMGARLQETVSALERVVRENELLLEAAADGIYRLDRSGRVVYVNPAALAMLGWAHGDLAAAPLHHLVHHSRADGSPYPLEECPIYATLRDGEAAAEHDDVFWRKDGTSFPVEYVSAPIREGDALVGAVVIFRDISDRRTAEEAVRMARDAALEASRLKSEFLATMSHEIRTPMNGVIGLTSLLLDTGLDERQREYAEGVRTAGNALLAIINDILDFSKIEAGRIDLEEISFDLVQVVEEVAQLLADGAQSKGLELVTFIEPDLPPTVSGDPGRLRQVLLNLLSNAVKFTAAGEIELRASLAEERGGTVLARFEVRDTGIGITEADLERIFDPFSQADASTTRRYGGTGLGLAVSRQLAELMGGELGAESRVGEGSTFWFTARFRTEPDAPRRPAHPGLLRGLRVLVVDDNGTNRLILDRQLTAWGMEPRLASSGPHALQIVDDEERFDLVVLDYHMPEMDGLELARRLTRDHPGLPLVLLSSVAEAPQVTRAAGVRFSLTKPVRQSQLYDGLVGVLVPEDAGSQPAPVPDLAGPGRGARVLVAEDNVINQQVAVGMLAHLGYEADVVADGQAAIEAAARGGYVAVLMDVQMPVLDGYEATAEIRRREGHGPSVPIIAMTAGVMEGDREGALAVGMNDYISKPVDPEQLRAALARWARPADQHAAPAAADLSTDGNAVIDEARWAMLRRIAPDDPTLLPRLLESFWSESERRISDLRRGIESGDDDLARRSAHSMRGSAANLGFTEVTRVATEIETGDELDPGAVDLLQAVLDDTRRAATEQGDG